MSSKKIPTFEFHHNIKKDYEEYLEKFTKFIEKSTKKTNKDYEITKESLIIKKNNKVIEKIPRPFFINTKDILKDLDDTINSLNKYKKEDKELIRKHKTTKMNIMNYNNEINEISRRKIEKRTLASKKVELKTHLASLYYKILENNSNDDSVKDLCKEYNIHNQILNIEKQMRELNEIDTIPYIIQINEPKIEMEEIVEEVPENTKSDDEASMGLEPISMDDEIILDIKPLNIDETDLELLASENEYNKKTHYENKPEVPPEDLALPDLEDIAIHSELKDQLLKPTKKKPLPIKIKIKKTKKKELDFCKDN
jgi:hypothetical protein